MPLEQTHRALSILKKVGVQSPDGPGVRAAETVIKLMFNSQSAAKAAPMEMAQEAGPDKPTLLSVHCI